jgi:hypothetical protein
LIAPLLLGVPFLSPVLLVAKFSFAVVLFFSVVVGIFCCRGPLFSLGGPIRSVLLRGFARLILFHVARGGAPRLFWGGRWRRQLEFCFEFHSFRLILSEENFQPRCLHLRSFKLILEIILISLELAFGLASFGGGNLSLDLAIGASF